MEKILSSRSVSLFYVKAVNDGDSWKTVHDELFQERAVVDRIVLFVDVDDSESWEGLELGDLE